MATKVAVIAGFEPFGGLKENPSGEAMAYLDGLCNGFETRSAVLSVCCSSAWDELRQAVEVLERETSFAIVMAGVATKRTEIEVERFALNCKDYRIPDNSKHQWRGEEIVEGAPAAIRSRVVDKNLLAFLTENSLRCAISNHAGTFVCNELYYRALLEWQDEPRCAGIVFAHVPPAPQYKESDKKQRERLATVLENVRSSGKNVGRKASLREKSVYSIYRYAEALALIARYLLK